VNKAAKKAEKEARKQKKDDERQAKKAAKLAKKTGKELETVATGDRGTEGVGIGIIVENLTQIDLLSGH
jgi:uncharacterized NAD-dependent epimerase/dehydratase family protein